MIFIYIIIVLVILYFLFIGKNIDDYINSEYEESNFTESKKKKPLQINNKKVYHIKTPNNLVFYKNVKKSNNILFFDDYHTYMHEDIICDVSNHYELVDFLRLFYKVNKKIHLFIEVIRPSEHYKENNDVIIENTLGFNSNNTITTIIDDKIFKECFYRGKKCNNFCIYSTDIRISNDMLINYYNISIKGHLSEKEMREIIMMTLYTEKNVYYIIFHYLKNKNKNPVKIKKYIHKNLNNEIYKNFQKLSEKQKKYVLNFIENVYIPKMKSYNFIQEYIYLFMDLLTIIKILLVPENDIIILYQGLYHNYYIRKFIDMYLKYDYKKRAHDEFKHKNKCIFVGGMDEIIV